MTAEQDTDGGFHEDMARLTRRRALDSSADEMAAMTVAMSGDAAVGVRMSAAFSLPR